LYTCICVCVCVAVCVRALIIIYNISVSYANPNCSHSRRVPAAADRPYTVPVFRSRAQSAPIYLSPPRADRRNRHYYITFVFVWIQRTLCAAFSGLKRARIMCAYRPPPATVTRSTKTFTHQPTAAPKVTVKTKTFFFVLATGDRDDVTPAGTVIVVEQNAAVYILQIIIRWRTTM